MYTRIPQSFFDILPQLSGADAKIMVVIYRFTVGWNRDYAILSLSVMAKHTGVTTRQITESLKHLRELNLITTELTTKGSRITLRSIEDISIEETSTPAPAIEETSIKVSKKLLPYKEKKESNTTSNDVVRKRVRKPKQDEVADKPVERTALTVFRKTHRLNAPIAIRDTITAEVTDIDRWEQICTEWIGKGFRPGNALGCLQVYKTGWRTSNDARQRQRGDVQQQRRNERMAQTIAEYDRENTA